MPRRCDDVPLRPRRLRAFLSVGYSTVPVCRQPDMVGQAVPVPAPTSERTARFLRVGRVWVQPRYVVMLQGHGLTGFSSVFRFEGGERLDKPGLARWRERRRVVLTDLAGEPRTFYLKRYLRPPLSQQLRRIVSAGLRQSTAGREWQTTLALAEAGIPVSEPVAFGQETRAGFERRSFIVLEAAPGRSLEGWLPVEWKRRAFGADFRRRRELVLALARQVAAFHAAGFVHRDLYASHIFIQDAAGGAPRFTFIDLQRVFRPRWRRRRWIVKDLAQLYYSTAAFASRADRLRFWREYLRSGPKCDRAEDLPKRIERKAAWIGRHDRNARGGPRPGPAAPRESVVAG